MVYNHYELSFQETLDNNESYIHHLNSRILSTT